MKREAPTNTKMQRANDWFRMYAEFASDPKVQMLSEAMQRRLVMLFCAQCSDVLVTLCDDDLAFYLGIDIEELTVTKAKFIEKGFIDDDWMLTNWNKRQFISDSSTERTRRYRERKRTSQKIALRSGPNALGNASERHSVTHVTHVTKCDAPDSDSDSDSDSENTLSSSGDDVVSESSTSSKSEKPNGKISASAADLDEYVHRWNTRCSPPLQAVRHLSKARLTRLKACVRENDLTLPRWDLVIAKLLATPFCLGAGPNEWRASFDWLITDDNIDRVIEGQFGKPEKPKHVFREMP